MSIMAPSQESSEYDQSLTDYILKSRKVKTTVLPVEHVSPKLQKIYETNATKSRLFSIPPELRNRIYRLVVAGKEIHVFGYNPRNISEARLNVKRKFFRSICQRDTTELEDARAYKACQEAKNQETFTQRHSKCQLSGGGSKPTSDFSLDFLRVCRQIHQEAALMPFQDNTFIFDDIIDLEGFVEFQIPAQVAAIQHISLDCRSFESDEAFEKRLQKKLGKLKNFIVFRASWLSDLPATVDIDHDATGSLLRFRRINIEKATFVAYNPASQAWSDERRHEALEWSRFMETALMKEWIEPEVEHAENEKEEVAMKESVGQGKKAQASKKGKSATQTKAKRVTKGSRASKKTRA
ncbi:hypothetical protein HII31_09562 [Pseudocercospora fuligena]|uniref:DUF7730 domain-containing protein n=1 Tax=Pseudocercospora fuligena TaxID=685502 RepID=A0A8H6VJL1_9PEZI|nr:hypothetical protein HII31_09562 [Pseudocercospora fuligena]